MNSEPASSGLGRATSVLLRLIGSWWLGFVLAGVATVIVVFRWSALDFETLVSVSPVAQVSAAAFYGAGLYAMAQMSREPGVRDSSIVAAGLSAQLLKYVPGTVWQGQRLLAVGGRQTVLRFALGVLTAAGASLAMSGRLSAVALGVTMASGALLVCRRTWGWSAANRILVWAMAVAVSVFASGALVGWGAGLDLLWSGREIAGAWGLGVAAVPVPAGLGIRELFLSLSDAAEAAAELGLVHRVVTLVTDAAVGMLGLGLLMRRR